MGEFVAECIWTELILFVAEDGGGEVTDGSCGAQGEDVFIWQVREQYSRSRGRSMRRQVVVVA